MQHDILGSTFSFVLTLPLVTKVEEKHILQNALADKQVLIVEDEKINQKVLQRALHHQGAKTIIASNGLEAVELFAKQVYDLVLLDINLPLKNGYEVAKEIRQFESQHTQKPCIIFALSANVMFEADNLHGVGMDDYLSKPFVPSKLIELAQSWLQ